MTNKMMSKKSGKKRMRKRAFSIKVSLFLLMTVIVGGTLAYLFDKEEPITNTFTPTEVKCDVEETFVDGETKKNVNVINNGNIPAYVRIKLVSYWVDKDEKIIGGKAKVPAFTPGDGWVKGSDGHYYYTHPVEPNEKPETFLIGENGIKLEQVIEKVEVLQDNKMIMKEVFVKKQVIEVMAEAIQADGFVLDENGKIVEPKTPAVTDAWGVSVDADGNLVIN